jgi:RND family efflux transporter MFP subunit
MRTRTVVGAMALAVTIGCAQGPAPPAGAPQGPPPVAVQVAPVETANVQDASEYVGMLKSLQSTSVQPQTEGQITQIYVKAGDHVKAGAPVAQIDARRQLAAVSSQEATRVSKEAALAYAKQQADRATQLFAAGAISKQELEQAQTAVTTADADLKAMQADVVQQQEQLRYFTVTAPMAGVIGDVPVRTGYQVTLQTVLTTIDANDTLELNVSIPIERVGSLKVGLPVDVLSSDGQKTLARTTINFIAGRVDDQTQSVLVKGQVPNANGALRSAQQVRVRVVWSTAPGLVVPVTAVLRINGQYFVFLAESENGKMVARQRPISVGPIVGNGYAVTSGLQAGDRLIVSGVQKLADGAPIAPPR